MTRQIEIIENSLLYCSWVTWCSTRAHTFTSCPLSRYTLPNIQIQAGIA